MLIKLIYFDSQLNIQDAKDVEFASISALHSEFLLVSKRDRKLWSWPIPRQQKPVLSEYARAVMHPRADDLGLNDERISIIDSSIIRSSLITESGKLCTFYDSVLIGLIFSFFSVYLRAAQSTRQFMLLRNFVFSKSICSDVSCTGCYE